MKPTLKQKIKLLIEKWEKAQKATLAEIHDPETMPLDIEALESIHVDRKEFIEDLKKLIES